ncbi:MAG: hypothetical protein V3T39_09485 [Gammaproteobacteria bacterium]
MRDTWVFTLLFAILFITGCEEPRINGSSEVAFHISSQRLVRAQPAEKREELEAALSRLLLAAMLDSMNMGEDKLRNLREKLDGMNAEQLLQFAISEDRRRLVVLRDRAQIAAVAAQTRLDETTQALSQAPDDESLIAARQKAETEFAVAKQEVVRRTEQIAKFDRGEDW